MRKILRHFFSRRNQASLIQTESGLPVEKRLYAIMEECACDAAVYICAQRRCVRRH